MKVLLGLSQTCEDLKEMKTKLCNYVIQEHVILEGEENNGGNNPSDSIVIE